MKYSELRERNVKPLSDSWGKYRYVIAIGDIGSSYYLVHGDSLQDALDFIVDIEGDNIPGFFCQDESLIEAYYDENNEDHDYMQDSFIPLGNAGELFTSEIHVLYEDMRGYKR
ncbi:MAG: hypothetical protein KKC77_19295 [Proteobacteria bacterium]|nr:hypothetical protein [Pseudomonadota bacterium]